MITLVAWVGGLTTAFLLLNAIMSFLGHYDDRASAMRLVAAVLSAAVTIWAIQFLAMLGLG